MFLLLAFCGLLLSAHAQISPQDAADKYALPTSTSLAFPTATLATDDTQNFITSKWGLSKGRIQNGAENLAFVDDPFPGDPIGGGSSGPVLQVSYEAGSYSHNTGGAQLYNLWNSSSPFQSTLLTYEVAFDQGFDWVKGGKLPGLRGGPAVNGCAGGSQPNGSDCFSARVMWRAQGAGEVYAYILRPNSICGSPNITCNDDFGVSVQRGSFTLKSGQWNRITMLVQLNTPNHSNGNLSLYYNNVLALQQANLKFRSSDRVNIGGFFLSTFFGGNDDSWATRATTHTYFRNIQMWGSSSVSTIVNTALPRHPRLSGHLITLSVLAALSFMHFLHHFR